MILIEVKVCLHLVLGVHLTGGLAVNLHLSSDQIHMLKPFIIPGVNIP